MSKLTETIGQLRRAMPRNAAVQFVCDEAERLQNEANVRKRQEAVSDTKAIPTSKPVSDTPMALPVSATECPLCAVRRVKQRKRVAAYRAKTGAKG